MKTHAPQGEQTSRTLDSAPRAARQLSIPDLLQANAPGSPSGYMRVESSEAKPTTQPTPMPASTIQLGKEATLVDWLINDSGKKPKKKKKRSKKQRKRDERNQSKKKQWIEAARKAFPEYSQPFPRHAEEYERLKEWITFEGPEEEQKKIRREVDRELAEIQTRHRESLANPVIDFQSAKTLVASQHVYEKTLDKATLMDTHRTMGIELEFAKYTGPLLDSHIVLAKSEVPILQSVPGEWVLETDSNQKLEIGVPPLLVKDVAKGKVNVEVINAQRNIIKSALMRARDKCTPGQKGEIIKFATQYMEEEGLGANWQWVYEGETKDKTKIKDVMAFAGAPDGMPEKVNERDPHGMYEQINLTLKPDEIAAAMIALREKEKVELKDERPYDWLYELYEAISSHFEKVPKLPSASPVTVHFSKAVASLGAIPSILAKNANINEGAYSGVKELFGIWTKDNAANVIAGAAGKETQSTQDALKAYLEEDANIETLYQLVKTAIEQSEEIGTITGRITGMKSSLRQEKNKEYRLLIEKGYRIGLPPENEEEEEEEEDTDRQLLPQAESKAEFKWEIIEDEIRGLFAKTLEILETGIYQVNPGGLKFGEEAFGGTQAGDGVRKETFINLPLSKRKLYLAEIRSGWSITRYLDTLTGQDKTGPK